MYIHPNGPSATNPQLLNSISIRTNADIIVIEGRTALVGLTHPVSLCIIFLPIYHFS
ncbi:hypothetical protein MBAV_000344 [Candidatus Magnetobacterium bavaricum]|uniref:Uncharacterized protein n=1 Tax=Candidatus Magnetobacterium bavaricum TaxID=29290 RepID=A0A0F3H041_9BACT|nr:hypothetical protein MBAV_000344 [Candidatus Magnetobacterium bavaricum]